MEVAILPELSGATLRRRGLLKPLLKHLKDHKIAYRWGTPFHLVVRRRSEIFFLRCPEDLPVMFHFLGIPTVTVPDWLQAWPFPARRRTKPSKFDGMEEMPEQGTQVQGED